jgi:hypothetical protein
MPTSIMLLPSTGRPPAAFPGGWNKYCTFLMHASARAPATVRLSWHMDDERASGHPVWKTRLIAIPDVEVYDVVLPDECQCAPGDMAEIIDYCDDPVINHQTCLRVDFTDCTDRSILLVYRDTGDPSDTAAGYAHLTEVVVQFQ